MRKLTGAMFITLDGVIQGPGGQTEDPTGGFMHCGWVAGHQDPVIDEVLGGLFTPPYALLLGRRTYDIFAGYWPFITGEEAAFGEALTAAEKHVLTRGDRPLDWANSHRLGGVDEVAALKATDGPDLLIQGSSTIYAPLLAAGLIDRLVLMIYPLILGEGKRPWGGAMPGSAWKLVDQRAGEKGVIVADLVPDGPVTVDTFGTDDPSPQERARRARMASTDTW